MTRPADHAGPSAAGYPIRAVARMTGLSLDTLRAWERRYEAVTPARGERGRLYSSADVARLRRLGQLVDRGHAIGSVARLPDKALDRLLEVPAEVAAPKGPAADLAPLIAALDRYDRDAFEAELTRHAVVLPTRDLVFAVVLPLLAEIGTRWEAGTLRPAQEHLASAIVHGVLGGLLRTTTRPGGTPRAVFATPPGERHELGLLCAALLTAGEGWGIVYLGPDLPVDDIWHAASIADARVVILSATGPGSLAAGEHAALARPPADVAIWVGGPASGEMLARLGPAGRVVPSLDALPAMLRQHAR